MNEKGQIVQILIFLACLAVLIINILTWRAMKKIFELQAQEREERDQAKTTTIHLGDLAPGESVSIPVRFKQQRGGMT